MDNICRYAREVARARRGVACLSVTSSLSLVLIGCGSDRVESENSTSDTTHADGGTSETMTETETETGVSSDMLGPPPQLQPSEFCPPHSSNDAGTNTLLRADYDPLAGPILPLADGMMLDCGGLEIPGETSVQGSSIIFTPTEELPSSTTCTATLPAGGQTEEGTQLAASWQFTTGETALRHRSFSEPEALSDELGLNPRMASEGPLVAVAWQRGPDVMLSVSDDAGETMTLLPPFVVVVGAAAIQDLDVQIINGVIHLTWCVWGEAFYARSLDDVYMFSLPLLLSTIMDIDYAYSPSVASDGADRVYVVYNEANDESVFSELLLARSIDGGANFEPSELVAVGRSSRPKVAWVDGGLLMTWIEDDLVHVVDAEQGYAEITTQSSPASYPLSQFPPLYLPDGGVLVHWLSKDLDTWRDVFVRVTSRDLAGVSEQFIHTLDGNADNGVRVAPLQSGSLVRTVVIDPNAPQAKSRHLLDESTAWDASFETQQHLDFMYPTIGEVGQDDIFELLYVAVGTGPDDVVHLSWNRHYPENPYPLTMFSRGQLVPPCSP